MEEPVPDLAFYQQLFTEPIFVVPEKTPIVAPEPVATSAPTISPAELERLGNTAPLQKYPIIGENRKGLVLLFSLPEKDFQAITKNDFLIKIIGAIKYTPADVAFVNALGRQPVNIHELSKEINLAHLIVFGKNIVDMTADSRVSYYKPASIGRTPLLIAEDLASIELDVNKKKLLWGALQTIFLK